MPYWIGGTIESDEDLLVLTPEVARNKRGIDVRMQHEVTAINRAEKRVEVLNLDSGETSTQAYDKLVIDKRDGRILGAQLVGKAGVNKRIDIIATAITAGMTVDQLGLLDLSYSPPYSPVYDPVQVAANVAMKQVFGVKSQSQR
jgi:NADPH-dependent 2,4-dienoyl-CoA reductase/sulfur reductase-like enzyme